MQSGYTTQICYYNFINLVVDPVETIAVIVSHAETRKGLAETAFESRDVCLNLK